MKHTTTALTALLLSTGTATYAQPGSLDDSFGTNGKVITSFGTGDCEGNSMAIQSNGKIVVAGYANNGIDNDFALVRYNADGSLDDTFGANGKVTTDFESGVDVVNSVVIQPDGKILVAGSSTNGVDQDLAIARYNENGTLDVNFSGDGKATNTDGLFGVYSIALQSDGKIVVAGSGEMGFRLVRYIADGTIDNNFGVGGIVITDNGAACSSCVVQSDGKIILVGTKYSSPGLDGALARYNIDGSPDNSFGIGGQVTTDFGSDDEGIKAVAIQSDGSLVVAGYTDNGTDDDFALARFNIDGTLDSNFGVNGIVITDFESSSDYAQSVTIQQDGRILAAGEYYVGPGGFALARYNTDGMLDANFGVAGEVTTTFECDYSFSNSVAINSDGKIVVAGTRFDAGYDIAVAGYVSGLNSGIIDYSLTSSAPYIYPNPITDCATLEYVLQQAEIISIRLLDMKGKTVQNVVQGQMQVKGVHKEPIYFPEAMLSGTYIIAISSPSDKLAVQVVR